jgi:hypothetical protein
LQLAIFDFGDETMKTIITMIAAALFTAGVSAADIYNGLAGNPDLHY